MFIVDHHHVFEVVAGSLSDIEAAYCHPLGFAFVGADQEFMVHEGGFEPTSFANKLDADIAFPAVGFVFGHHECCVSVFHGSEHFGVGAPGDTSVDVFAAVNFAHKSSKDVRRVKVDADVVYLSFEKAGTLVLAVEIH